ncbi:MAG: dockerin type I repeat-containing protein, partial [Clostridia bacterium]|nr:dockerin type I repeat-containing protein [Clostridia bacterium]
GGAVYVNGFNTKVSAGDCIIFTPDFGEITGDAANHVWTANVIAEWNESENAYVVKSTFLGTGMGNTQNVTLSENEIMIAAHDWESDVNDGTQVLGSAANASKIKALVEGDVIVLDGIDAKNKKFDVAPYVYISKLDTENAPTHAVATNPESFWVTHFNDMSLEGVGVICTGDKGGSAWWISVAFAPVDGYDNVYEVVEKTDGTADGSGKVLNVPAGGFVWSGNYGNDYPSLYASNPTLYAAYADASQYPNYTNAGAQKSVAAAKSWNVGDKFVIDGIDFEFKSVPTTTPGLNWFDAGYVSTATIGVFDPDASVECKHDYESVVTDPDCENGGYTTHTCTICGDTYTDGETDALGHDYDSVVTDPDCENGGYTTHTCTICGDTYTDSETDALGHTEGEWVTLPDGSKELRCDECGELLDSVPAPEYAEGDVNGDGNVNMFDYLMVKSIYFEKATPTEDQLDRADLTGDGKVNLFDYIALKSLIISK